MGGSAKAGGAMGRAAYKQARFEAGEEYSTVATGGVGRDARLDGADRVRARSALIQAASVAAEGLPWLEAAGGLRVEDRDDAGPHYPHTLHVGERRVAAVSDSWALDRLGQGEGALADAVADLVGRSGIERYLRKHGDL